MKVRPYVLAALLVVAAIIGVRQTDDVESHALLVRADPPVNAQLREAPSQITLYFSEPLEEKFSRVSVVNQDGARVDDRFEFDAADDALMRVFLQPLEPGYITINWETVSTVDGHYISGSFPITILNADGSPPPGQPVAGSASVSGQDPEPLRVVDKWVLLIAGSVLVGTLAFGLYVLPGARGAGSEAARQDFGERVSMVAGVALVVLAVAGLIELLLQANDINASVGDVLGTQWGERWTIRNLLLIPIALLVLGLIAGLANRALLAFLALLGAGAYLVVTSSAAHAAAGGGDFWAIASDFVHLTASSVWIGTLGVLFLLFLWCRAHLQTNERYPVLAGALQRFSLLAVVSVALLLFTGTANALVEVGKLPDMLETGYGRALTIKLALLIPLLAVAGYNAYILRPDLVEATGPETTTRDRQNLLQNLERQLYSRIRIEAAIALAVLAVVAVLVQLTPTRGRLATPEQGPGEYTQMVEIENLQATLRITPNQPGVNTFEVYLAGGVDVIEGLRLEFTGPGGTAAGDSRLPLDPSNPPSFYIGQGPYLSSEGLWTVTLNIRRTVGGFDLRPTFEVDVEGPAAVAESTGRAGGSFDSPVEFNTASIALLVVSGVVSVAVVAGSIPRPGLQEGYLGWLATEAVYRLGPLNVRPAWTLAALVVGGIAIGIIVSSHLDPPLSQEEASRENPIESSPESIARGQMLFSQNCTVCHGETGRGDGPAAASLPLQPANLYDHVPYHPDQYFFGVISKGLSGVMPAFEGSISEEDRWNILNYLRATFTAEPAER